RLAHDGEAFTFVNVKTHVLDGVDSAHSTFEHRAFHHWEFLVEVLNIQGDSALLERYAFKLIRGKIWHRIHRLTIDFVLRDFSRPNTVKPTVLTLRNRAQPRLQRQALCDRYWPTRRKGAFFHG